MTSTDGLPEVLDPDAPGVPTCPSCNGELTWDLDHWAHNIDGDLVAGCTSDTPTRESESAL